MGDSFSPLRERPAVTSVLGLTVIKLTAVNGGVKLASKLLSALGGLRWLCRALRGGPATALNALPARREGCWLAMAGAAHTWALVK